MVRPSKDFDTRWLPIVASVSSQLYNVLSTKFYKGDSTDVDEILTLRTERGKKIQKEAAISYFTNCHILKQQESRVKGNQEFERRMKAGQAPVAMDKFQSQIKSRVEGAWKYSTTLLGQTNRLAFDGWWLSGNGLGQSFVRFGVFCGDRP